MLPIWRLALFVGFFSVGVVLNSMWGMKLFKGAYKLMKGGDPEGGLKSKQG